MGQAFHTSKRHRGHSESALRPEDASVSASPREVLMGAKRYTTVFLLVVFSTAGTWAADELDSSMTASATVLALATATTLPSSTEILEVEPWIHGDMREDVRTRLEAGFDIAVQKVQEVSECNALFEELGADALETLSTGLYFPIASHRKEKAVCRGAVAFTNVGAAPTFLCREFSRMTDERAAMYVVHEALHHAGLTEKPLDPGAMTSRAINRMVTDACKF